MSRLTLVESDIEISKLSNVMCHSHCIRWSDIAISLISFYVRFKVSIHFNVLNVSLPELLNVRVTDYSQVNR